jgi:hypothetical protein
MGPSSALGKFIKLHIIYHNGRKYRVSQLIVQDAESALIEAKISTKAGYFLTADQKDLEICPFTGLNLGDNANKAHLHHLLEMAESRAEEVDRISCEEEERVSRGTRSRRISRWMAGISSACARPWPAPVSTTCSICVMCRPHAWCT